MNWHGSWNWWGNKHFAQVLKKVPRWISTSLSPFHKYNFGITDQLVFQSSFFYHRINVYSFPLYLCGKRGRIFPRLSPILILIDILLIWPIRYHIFHISYCTSHISPLIDSFVEKFINFLCVCIATKGPFTRCYLSCNLQWNSTFRRCKISKHLPL